MSLNVKYQFWILLVLCVLSLLVPFLIREKFSKGIPVDIQSYKSLRLANDIKQNGIISNDKLSYGNKVLFEEKLWYFLLSFNPNLLAKFLPILFGILSFIFFYLIISRNNKEIGFLSSLILIFTPSFLYLFSVASKYTAAIFFILLGIYLFRIEKKNFAFASFFISGFFSILSLFLVLIVFLFISLKKENYKDFSVLFFGTLIVALVQFYQIFLLGIPKIVFGVSNFTWPNFFSFIMFGLGGKYGFGFFILFLAIVGIYQHYREKYKFLIYYLALAVFLLLSFYFNFILSYLTFVLAFFAAIGILFFSKNIWKVETFKFLTLLVIFCGLLFSVLVYYNNAKNFDPSVNYFDGLQYLKNNPSNGFTFTDLNNGEYLAYSGHKVFLDNNFLYSSNITGRLKDYNFILNNSNLTTTLSLLRKYDIDYILIDKNMKKQQFHNNDNGFLFLLKYSPNIFIKTFNNDAITIWEFNSSYGNF